MAQYRRYLKSQGIKVVEVYGENQDDFNLGAANRESHPVNFISHEEAASFCAWFGGRLPTEAEWIAEATFGRSRKWPWGNTPPDCKSAVLKEDGLKSSCKNASTLPVCSKPAGNSVSGLCDMIGNVSEATLPNFNAVQKPLHGKSWMHNAADLNSYVRDASRWADIPGGRTDGFRCIKPPKSKNASETLSFYANAACKRIDAFKTATDAKQTLLLIQIIKGPSGTRNLIQAAEENKRQESDPGRVAQWEALIDSMNASAGDTEQDASTVQEHPCAHICDVDTATLHRRSAKHLYLTEGVSNGPEIQELDPKNIGAGQCHPFENGALVVLNNPVPCAKNLDDAVRFETFGDVIYLLKHTLDVVVLAYVPAIGSVSHVDLGFAGFGSYGINQIEIREALDLNADGHKEALLLSYSLDTEESSGEWTKLIRFENGRLTPFKLGPGIDDSWRAIGFWDETGDGQKDILLARSASGVYCGSGFGYPIDTPSILGEGAPDGTFHFDTASTRAFARQRCPLKLKSLSTAQEVACAKLIGMKKDDALKEIRKVRKPGCKAGTDEVDDYPSLIEAASFTFPFVLDTQDTPLPR